MRELIRKKKKTNDDDAKDNARIEGGKIDDSLLYTILCTIHNSALLHSPQLVVHIVSLILLISLLKLL